MKQEIEKEIIELAKSGKFPNEIGRIIAKKYGKKAKDILNERITKILKKNNAYNLPLPEDLLFLMKRAVTIREHLKVHKKDKHSRRGLELIESKIKSLAKYYKRGGIIPEEWVYDPEEAKIIVGKVYGKI